MGSRTRVSAFTEVVFKRCPSERDIRPDGLLVVDTSHRKWSALIEAKIGTDMVGADQIQNYVELAKANDVDAVITMSNQFTAFPDQHPTYTTRNNFPVYHFSWMQLITIATLLLGDSEEEFDASTLLILKEMLRFFSHPNIDVRGFHRMTPYWEDLVSGVRAGKVFKKSDREVIETVTSWHQEEQDLCLMLTRNLGVPVVLNIPRKYRDDHLARIEDDARTLAESGTLSSRYTIPDAAGPLDVTADVGRRTITCELTVRAPEDRQSYQARLNWLLRQLPDEVPASTYVRVLARGITPKQARITDLREDIGKARPDNPNVVPTLFQICAVTDLAGRFAGRQTFIEALEKAVPDFYDAVVSHINEWVPSPPSGPATRTDESLEEAVDRISSSREPAGEIIRSGTISGRRFAIFADGSIQVETREGLKMFKNFAALRNELN